MGAAGGFGVMDERQVEGAGGEAELAQRGTVESRLSDRVAEASAASRAAARVGPV